MKNEEFNFSLKAKLSTLFSKYKDILTQPEQLKILKNNFVFSEVDPTAEVLVMGINPSLRNDFVGTNGYSYDYKTLASDRYFKKFSNLLSDFDEHGITYCDLFYQRHTEQKQISHFLNDELGRAFLKEQLVITKEIIESINPKLILLFNRQGAQFFSPQWLAFNLNDFDNPQATALTTDRLKQIQNLRTIIYFSSFLGYRTPKKVYSLINRDLQNLTAIFRKQ